MKLSKVVLIVVALHVLVIGGIFVFEGCSRAKAPAPDNMADNESPAGNQSAANAPALPAPQPVEATAQNNLTPAGPAAPAPAVAATTTTQPAARTYVVKKGDSLWKIAKVESVSIGDLARANNLTKTSALKTGQKLQIPASAKAEAANTATASAVPTATSVEAGGQMYTVKSGDSLWKIARAQNVTVTALKQANNLSSDSLKVGQKLHIPAATATTTASANNGGSTPTVNAGIATASYSDWHEPGTATENGQTIHYVDFGESPALIAKKYGVKVEDLMKVNNITDARRIVVGQKLIIPTAPAATSASSSTTRATPAVAAPIVSAKQASIGD
jgi:peptidoglycan endopeptidase LytF